MPQQPEEREVRGVGGGPFGAALSASQSTVFVDVGAKRVDANVSRNGVPVGVHEIDPDVLNDVIVDKPPAKFVIVSQSVKAGTPVPVGAAVDLILARPGTLPLGILVGVHIALKNEPIDRAYARLVAGNPQVNRIVARAASGPLSKADEQAVAELFLSKDVPLADQPGRDVTAAVETLRALVTFGG